MYILNEIYYIYRKNLFIKIILFISKLSFWIFIYFILFYYTILLYKISIIYSWCIFEKSILKVKINTKGKLLSSYKQFKFALNEAKREQSITVMQQKQRSLIETKITNKYQTNSIIFNNSKSKFSFESNSL